MSVSVREGSGHLGAMDAIPAEVWSSILEVLPNSAVCSLSGASRAHRQLSCLKRSLNVELDADEHLHSRLVSLLYFLTSRREHLQVCCVYGSVGA